MIELKIVQDRRLSNVDYEVRNDEEQPLKIVGYALKFDRASEDLGFIEYIDRGAFDNADISNVVALINHDSNYVLGRSGKNLSLEVDEIGLRFSVEPTDTSYAKDLVENMRNGLVDKCSFAFTIADDGGDNWEKNDDGKYIRHIKKIERLYDVSVVTTPAYEDTEAVLSSRSIDSLKEIKHDRSREVALMDMELELWK